MNIHEEQAAILHTLLQKEKKRLGNSEMKKKLFFLLYGSTGDFYRKKVEELTAIMNVCEELLFSQKYQRALYFICVAKKKVDYLQKYIDGDFLDIQKSI